MLLRGLRERFVTHLIGDYVPVLNLVRRPAPWPGLDELRAYPEGSLGRAVAAYLDARGLPFRIRYENHDAIDALLDYETNIRGEMEVQAFLSGQRRIIARGAGAVRRRGSPFAGAMACDARGVRARGGGPAD